MLLDETPLFEPSLLRELDWSSNTASFSPPISPCSPGEGLVLRPLCMADFNRGFFKVLSQLTKTGDVTPEQFAKNFEHMKKTGDYYVIVVEDTNLSQIVATATLITEHKFIHSCAKRGRVEEVVVSDVCRGKQLGKLLVSTLTLLSKKLNCYKITLECAPKNVAFYQKFGYSASDETYMQCRFFDWERKVKKKKKICFGKNGLYLCTPGDNQNLQNVLRTGASRGWGCCCVTAESSKNTHHDFSTLE